MTRSAHDEAVEAACRERYAEDWEEMDARERADALWEFRNDVAAYLRHMRAAGSVVAKVPGELLPFPGVAYIEGWNAARAEMLANAVEVPE